MQQRNHSVWNDRPVRVAIIGSGPSGVFTCDALLKSDITVLVDIFEELPTPYGLIRFGVAPDHQKIKKVINKLDCVLKSKNVAYYGNVSVGEDISVEELRLYYDVIVFACGALEPKPLHIPGEKLPGNHAAIEFIGWLNGHPRYRHAQFDLTQETVAVIGHGNVALDVARILGKTADELKNTDIVEHALNSLAESKIKHIYLIGRRGPIQAAFSYKELKEIGELPSCHTYVCAQELALNDASHQELMNQTNNRKQQIFSLINDIASRTAAKGSKRIELKFLRSPIAISGKYRVEKLICDKNKLTGAPGYQRSSPTGEKEELECGLIFSSIGYNGKPMPGIPIDDKRGVLANREGRIFLNGTTIAGSYAVGWIQRGPSGLIGNSRQDAAIAAKNIVEDLPNLNPCSIPASGAIGELLNQRQVKVVNFEDWEKIDAAEKDHGQIIDKPREKFCSLEEMLSIL